MLNIQKQIDCWMYGEEDDLITAQILIQERRTLHGLFFCHLVIEKALKAHWVKEKKEVAASSHNLIYLAEETGLELDSDSQIFPGILMKYQLEGRYPDDYPILPDQYRVDEYLNKTKGHL